MICCGSYISEKNSHSDCKPEDSSLIDEVGAFNNQEKFVPENIVKEFNGKKVVIPKINVQKLQVF